MVRMQFDLGVVDRKQNISFMGMWKVQRISWWRLIAESLEITRSGGGTGFLLARRAHFVSTGF
jgi:hypothetical protein